MEPTTPPAVDTTNYQKFQTRNPVVSRLIGGFFVKLRSTIAEIKPQSVLDAGCGEGETLSRLADLLPADVTGFDINPESVAFTQRRHPKFAISRQSIYELPYEDKRFELAFCCEVLEHLDEPGKAIAELVRVTRGHLLLTVPHEPWFRLGSLARGKYLSTWGNHPEHIQHWNPASFRRFLSDKVESVEVSGAFPWIVAVCKVGSK